MDKRLLSVVAAVAFLAGGGSGTLFAAGGATKEEARAIARDEVVADRRVIDEKFGRLGEKVDANGDEIKALGDKVDEVLRRLPRNGDSREDR